MLKGVSMWCLALQRVMCSLQAHQEVMSEGGEGLGVEKGGEEEGRRGRREEREKGDYIWKSVSLCIPLDAPTFTHT